MGNGVLPDLESGARTMGSKYCPRGEQNNHRHCASHGFDESVSIVRIGGLADWRIGGLRDSGLAPAHENESWTATAFCRFHAPKENPPLWAGFRAECGSDSGISRSSIHKLRPIRV